MKNCQISLGGASLVYERPAGLIAWDTYITPILALGICEPSGPRETFEIFQFKIFKFSSFQHL